MLVRTQVFLLLAIFCLTKGEICDKIYGSEDSFVCICKDTACSTIGKVDPPLPENFKIVTSSREQLRFDIQELPLNYNSSDPATDYTTTISLDVTKMKQTINGFGGAFTDATGINIATLDPSLQETLIRHYFGAEGIEYSLGRVPIAGSDFSTYAYSYDDVDGDVNLNFFNLTKEDHLYKIPYIKMAQNVTEQNLKLFASPWAPPYWMKTNRMANGSGSLVPEYQQPWANYFIRFFEAYEQESITFWGVTSQNEPTQGLYTDYKWNACGFNASYMRDFIRDYLGPTLKSSKYAYVNHMITDDSRDALPWYPERILNDTVAASYVDGIAIHWYADIVFPPTLLDDLNAFAPDKFFLYTEACHVPKNLQNENAVKLGSWGYGEGYANNIIEDLNHWVTGWVDWNMVLDMEGGPNWVQNYVDAPIIVSEDGYEFYKQPMFYALGHFSKFIPEGSIVVESTVTEDEAKPLRNTVFSVSVLTPDNNIVVVVLNQNDNAELLSIQDTNGVSISYTIPARSFNTFIYSNNG